MFAFFAIGIWLGYFLEFRIIAMAIIFIAMGLLLCVYRMRFVCCLFLCVILLGAVSFELADSFQSPLGNYENQVVVVRGQVESVQQKKDKYRLVIKANAWEYKKVQGKISEKILIRLKGDLAGIENPHSIVGKDVQFKGKVSYPTGRRNPGLFDYRLYLKTRKIYMIMDGPASYLTVMGTGNHVAEISAKIKYRFSEALDARMSEDVKGLMLGMLFGDKTFLDENLYESFQRNGTAHILAVSGIHVGIIYLYISKLFRNRRSLFSSFVGLSLLFLYAVLASFSPSVVRAVAMISLHIISKHLHRRYDLLCCASFVALVMLLFNPFNLFNLGFQLSFLAVFTLAFLLPLANSKLDSLFQYRTNYRITWLFKNITPIVVIQAGMIPITAYLFQYVSFSAFFLNLPVIALAGFIIPLGMSLIFLSFFGGIPFDLVAAAVEILMKLLIYLNTSVGEWSISSINVIAPSVGVLVLYYGYLFFFSSEFFWICIRKRNFKIIAAISLIVMLIALMTPFIIGEKAGKADIVFVDIGQGDCIHIRTPSGKNILIDGGGHSDYDVGKEILLPYLLKNRVAKIDLALVTHLHDDHYKGIASICQFMPVKKLGLYEANSLRQQEILTETKLNKENLIYLTKGHHFNIEKGITIDILYPPKQAKKEYKELIEDESDENRNSLLIRVSYNGVTILITGDMGFDGENAWMELFSGQTEILQNTILKIGHHGSRYSTGQDFLRVVKPQIAVIQVGKNNFGHPHPDVIEKLKKEDIMVYRTDVEGAVLVDIKRGKVRVRTMLSGN